MSLRPGVLCMLALTATGCDRRPAPPEQAAATADEVVARPAAAPQAGTVDRGHRGEAPPAAALTDLDGRPVALAAFKGRPVLVNLWATWCAPCIAEMPTLEHAAATLTGKVQVIAVAQGDDAARVRPFAARTGMKAVRPLIDRELGLSLGYRANLPTTVLLGADGREMWRVAGDRDWGSAASLALIREAT